MNLGQLWAFETTKPIPSSILSPNSSHLDNKAIPPNPSNPFRQFYSLVPKHSNMWVYEGHSDSKHYKEKWRIS